MTTGVIFERPACGTTGVSAPGACLIQELGDLLFLLHSYGVMPVAIIYGLGLFLHICYDEMSLDTSGKFLPVKTNRHGEQRAHLLCPLIAGLE